MALCAVVFVVLYSCVISFFFLRTETKKILKRSLWSNFKSKKELLLVSELCSFIRKIASIFLDSYSLNVPSACIRFRLISNLISNALFFSNNNIVFLAEAEVNIFIFLPNLG